MRSSDRGPPDVPAFEDAYEATFQRVWRLLRRLGIPKAERPDIAQEVFLRVSQELTTRDTTVDLVAWIFKIANHAATRHRRLARNHRERLANEAEDLPGYCGDTRLIDGVAHRELCRLVDTCVQAIGDVHVRLVFVMRDIEQMTFADITRALGIPKTTARRHLAKARKRFEAAVNSLDPADREVLGVRRSGVIPFFALDLARLAEAERYLDESIADIQEQIWGRLQERMRAGADGGRAPRGAARRALRRIPNSGAQALGATLVVFVAGVVVGNGLFADRPLFASESEASARIALDQDDVVFPGATTTPAGSTPGAMVASPTGAAPRSSPPQAAPASRRAAGIPRAARNLDDEEEVLLDRARVHLTRSTPRLDLAITSLRLHAQRYPNSPHARERESLLRSALALAEQASQATAGSTTNPTPEGGP